LAESLLPAVGHLFIGQMAENEARGKKLKVVCKKCGEPMHEDYKGNWYKCWNCDIEILIELDIE